MLRRRRPAQTVNNRVPSIGSDLHLSLAQLRTALNALPMGVIVVDEFGKEFWRNRAAHGLFDAMSEGKDVDATLQHMAVRALRGRSEITQVAIDGPPQRMLEAQSISLINGGALVVLEDITERFLTDKVRTDFVANISHELKTPVGALSVLAETIIGELEADGGQPDLVPLVKHMVAESHRVARIIDDLLELATIEFRGEVNESEVSIGAIVGESISRVQPKAGSLGITIRRDGEVGDLRVIGDERQLVSALSNLVENAVKYSERGDTVTVRVSETANDISISVEDEGMGISPEHVDRVFERFYRVDQARSRQTGGTGLGLAIVRHVVTNHGGEVMLSSVEGEGSVFTLRLPKHRATV